MTNSPARRLLLLGGATAAVAVSAVLVSQAYASGAAQWTITPAADIGKGYEYQSVAAIGDDDVWAVGSLSSDDPNTTMAAHWDGKAWNQTPTPEGWDLDGVSGSAGDDVWAVGRGAKGSVTAHWDGKSWGNVDPGKPELPSGETAGLYAVDTADNGQAWAGGCGDSDTASTAFMQHWDGGAWTPSALPIPQGVDNSCVFAVKYVSDTEVWALGSTWQKSPWMLRWDGQKWNTETTPSNADNVQLTGLMTGAGDGLPGMCASGYTLDKNMKPHPYLMCRDGDKWTQVDAPKIDAFISSIGSDGAGGAYLTGRTFQNKPVLLHYDGTTVTQEDAPSAKDGSLADIDSAPGSKRVWVVGAEGSDGFAAHSG
ncbi:MAG TPA: hypothetical protein VE172_15780 [Stackebrandtia sp.]|jgi:hypothetical protein|uniref:hypothetical protein n=1 Tax=Stackebrandtia sp. TaxID=2023065 RepID=UPI002D6DBA4F|nr:hypothetical protein [Stackebrandtia sp.]HZE40264.1 hypothetical protein [Stackebrandtia sp.]